MKKIISLFLGLLYLTCVQAQNYTPYYYQRATEFNQLPYEEGSIIFCGDSITDGGEWSEWLGNTKVLNRGISGDIAEGVLNRVGEMIARKPAKLFLLIGVNDLAAGKSTSFISTTIRKIIDTIQKGSPATQLFLQSVLPVNPYLKRFPSHTDKSDSILILNQSLRSVAADNHIHYVDLYSKFTDTHQLLDSAYTNDGLHLNGKGYKKWLSVVYPLLYEMGTKPALIPQPSTVNWKGKSMLLTEAMYIHADPAMQQEVQVLEKICKEKRIRTIQQREEGSIPVYLKQKPMNPGYLKEEAYELSITDSSVHLYAETRQGMFYAIQTLRQLLRDGLSLPQCIITDKPAFAWRGMMHDVGRNYQNISLLKEQIEVMAQYKLNRFHLHLTEDIAWRMESKRYPQLTKAVNMTRDAGNYYTVEEIKDLVRFCSERYITLIPELDMPGHSAAFRKAMGVDMQSAEGRRICSELLQEFCEAIDVPYLHIGGDEVKISDPGFLPAVCNLLTSLGKKVIAWDPGGNVTAGTILQMWNGNTVPRKDWPSLDSRHLYMNHHDPIDGVVSVFNHSICDVEKGDSMHLGAIACVWPDRRVSQQEDILRMNPVYPELLALAERSWHGGGWKNYLSDIGTPGTDRYRQFTEFESRLTEHQQLYFTKRPFPYVQQSGIHWKLIGPYDNKGNTSAGFAPDTATANIPEGRADTVSVYGGTIYLRHFWAPLIGSHLKNVKENSTYYAFTSVYSPYDQPMGMWIGFYNISRSNNTATPEAGRWDNRNSRIWLNGKEIPPPHWSKPGRHPDNLEEPLIDEGYEYRDPAPIELHKGWNRILIKIPAAAFKQSDWQSPLKWMFSCMPVQKTDGINYHLPQGLVFDPAEKAVITK